MDLSWRLASACDDSVRGELLDLHPLVAQLLFNRGIRSLPDARAFLSPDYTLHTHDPYLFSEMRLCVERIIAAYRKEELVTIYGDYDVDGLSASTLLFDVLTLLGIRLDVHINHREKDGYGLQMSAIREIAKRGTTLIITTDCGISNKEEIRLARELGMDVIITDHHTVPERIEDIPAAYGILHPLVRARQYPFKFLSGGGVAFKLVQGLIRADFDELFVEHKKNIRDSDGRQIHWEAYEKWLLDLVCISTVGDCMPLVGENRTFTTYGLIVLAKTKRPGLRSLLTRLRGRIKEFTPHTIGFLIGPRLNAASRMEHGRIAFDLLTARDEESADTLANVLEQKNIERQKATERVFNEAKEHLSGKVAANTPVLIAYSPDWPLGLLGLVAGKLTNLYHRPAVLMTRAHGTIAGAGRSVEHFDIAAGFSQLREYFLRFGGHKAAGGFALKSVEDIPEFIRAFEELGEKHMQSAGEHRVSVALDACVSLMDITKELVDQIKSLKPFGQGNPKPLFLITSVTVIDARTVGTTGKHLKLTVQQDGVIRRGIGFGLGDRSSELSVGSRIDCVCEVEENEWNGRIEVQLTVRDFRVMSSELLVTQATAQSSSL